MTRRLLRQEFYQMQINLVALTKSNYDHSTVINKVKISLTSSFYSACRIRLYEQAPETSLSAEVYHQTSLVIDTHAGWVQRTCQKILQKHTGSQRKPLFFENLV